MELLWEASLLSVFLCSCILCERWATLDSIKRALIGRVLWLYKYGYLLNIMPKMERIPDFRQASPQPSLCEHLGPSSYLELPR